MESFLFVGVHVCGSWEPNIVGSKLQDNLDKYETNACIYVHWDVKFVGKGYPQEPRTLVPHGQWWFHSTCLKIRTSFCFYM